jgi:YVTN family beta-propeller protein
MFSKRNFVLGVITLALLIPMMGARQAQAAGATAPFKVQQVWPLGADDRWDNLTLDAKAHLLYISRATRVQVVDVNTGKLAADITGFKHTHGVALDAAGKYGYISDGEANQVIVFDRVSYKIVAKIDAPTGPDFIIFEPKTGYVLAFNHTSYDATVIDTKTLKVIAMIPLPGEPEGAQVDGAGTIFLNIETAHALVRIDVPQLKVTATWPLAPCTRPTGLGFDPAHKRLFSVCGNQKMVAVDSESGKVVFTTDMTAHAGGAAYDAKDALVFTANGGDGTLSIYSQQSPDNYKLVQTLVTRAGARTIAYDAATNIVYLAAANSGPVPAPTAETPKPKAPIVPNTFVVMKVGR